jgi:hypothetical protein
MGSDAAFGHNGSDSVECPGACEGDCSAEQGYRADAGEREAEA